MSKAQEMKALTDNAIPNIVETLYLDALDRIERKASEGHEECLLNTSSQPDAVLRQLIAKLEADGFEISDRNSRLASIHWADPKA